jgi:hypothetical protein
MLRVVRLILSVCVLHNNTRYPKRNVCTLEYQTASHVEAEDTLTRAPQDVLYITSEFRMSLKSAIKAALSNSVTVPAG